MRTLDEQLPTHDAALGAPDLDLDSLALHWAAYAARRPMTGEQMRGADRRAQRMGMSGRQLMEEAGAAVAVAVRATLNSIERPSSGLILALAGPGNNGGDAFVAARHLAVAGQRVYAVLVSSAERPGTPDAAANWDRLEDHEPVQRVHAAAAHDVALLLNGIERASLVIDGLLGSGVRGPLRDPIAQAVEVCRAARRLGVPVLSIDTPTAVDLTSGMPSEPAVMANVTVTFHRPKQGLLMAPGRALAGRLLVAPIGIPSGADSW